MAGVPLRVGISTAATDLAAPPLPPSTVGFQTLATALAAPPLPPLPVGVRTSATTLAAPPLHLRVGVSAVIPVPPAPSPPGPSSVMVFGATGTVVGDAVFL